MAKKHKEFIFRSHHDAEKFAAACRMSGSKDHMFMCRREHVYTNLSLDTCRRVARFVGLKLPDYLTATEEDYE